MQIAEGTIAPDSPFLIDKKWEVIEQNVIPLQKYRLAEPSVSLMYEGFHDGTLCFTHEVIGEMLWCARKVMEENNLALCLFKRRISDVKTIEVPAGEIKGQKEYFTMVLQEKICK